MTTYILTLHSKEQPMHALHSKPQKIFLTASLTKSCATKLDTMKPLHRKLFFWDAPAQGNEKASNDD